MDYEAWRCPQHAGEFCPPEGCPKWLGCARKYGWESGQPTPPEYQGYRLTLVRRALRALARLRLAPEPGQ